DHDLVRHVLLVIRRRVHRHVAERGLLRYGPSLTGGVVSEGEDGDGEGSGCDRTGELTKHVDSSHEIHRVRARAWRRCVVFAETIPECWRAIISSRPWQLNDLPLRGRRECVSSPACWTRSATWRSAPVARSGPSCTRVSPTTSAARTAWNVSRPG